MGMFSAFTLSEAINDLNAHSVSPHGTEEVDSGPAFEVFEARNDADQSKGFIYIRASTILYFHA